MKKALMLLTAVAVLGAQTAFGGPAQPQDTVHVKVDPQLRENLARQNGESMVKGPQFKDMMARKIVIESFVEKTVKAANFRSYPNDEERAKEQKKQEEQLREEARKVFVTYAAKTHLKGKVQEAAYKPLAELLTSAIGLKNASAQQSAGYRDDFAIQYFFSSDIPGSYAALKAVNPELAASTNELMKSFMEMVENGTHLGSDNHPDKVALRAFQEDIYKE